MPATAETAATAPTLKQSTFDRLRAMILSGALRPGEALRERELAVALGVSRTPLREALNKLEIEGLVEGAPHRGFRVTVVDLKTAGELLDLRKMLDGYAAGLAAESISPAGIADLEAVMARLARFEARETLSLEDLAEEVRIGMRIHEIIARETGHGFLIDTLTALYGRLSLLIWVDVLWVDRWELTRAEHKEIVAAVIARDAARAAAAAEAHVTRARAALQRVVDAQSLLHGSARGRTGDVPARPARRP
ncbi:GntR family transcriptional regulator [Aquibium sp. A9E412]|uniref:GntR family transcriptional regulator n=1 Tax=Aquibium sp. A9E412 TaxID=2976767 RepID=UPI0025AF72F6|nr:GntR family transcriptional regulator [Aquibium sp. A9E412]MDN2567465.1 GntR family transcriptional regulator [Aquibium sp. A9E412]